jgi:IS1 family transposase
MSMTTPVIWNKPVGISELELTFPTNSSIKFVMNKLPLAKRVMILSMLCEGSSMRSISRIADVSINTVTKLLVDAGETCLALHDELVRDVKASKIQCDEIWSFVGAKQRNVATAKGDPHGDVWTWTALDSDTKLMVSYFVGDRSGQSAICLMDDLRARLANRVQLTTDGHKAYLEAVEGSFGGDVDYAQLIKIYGSAGGEGSEKRYSPAECTGIRKHTVEGNPDEKHISTSYVERANLSIRMQNRRFTRLTNAFSKKLDNHIHALALYFAFYNFVRIHKTLKMTPAMAAGITTTLWSMEDIANRIDARAAKPALGKRGPRGPYKKRMAA